jgi:PAS domain S-box-containing protein
MPSEAPEQYPSDPGFKRVLALSIVMIGLLFGLWEYIEINYIHDWQNEVAHGAHIVRGILAGTILGALSLGTLALYKRRSDEQLRRAHRQQVRLQRFQENLLQSSSIGITTLDEEGRVIYANPAFRHIVGLGPEELLSMDFLESLPGREEAGWHDAIELGLERGEAFEIIKKPLQLMNAKTILVDAKGVPLKLEGNRKGLLLLVEDVTEQAHMEKELALFEKQASLGVLTGGVAHEINSPLGNMSIIVQRMRRGALGQHHKEELAGLDEQIEKINGIVEGLVEFSKRTGSVKDVLRVEDIISYSLDNVPIPEEIDFVRGPDNGVMVEGDFEQLSRAISNVLANTIDSLEASDGPKEMRIGMEKMNGMAVITVQDTGIGIPEEDISRIFDPFFSTKPEGTGLGLSITYNVVKAHKGSIEVFSEGGLTEFKIFLPVAEMSGGAG